MTDGQPNMDCVEITLRQACDDMERVMTRHEVGSADWHDAASALYGLGEVLRALGLSRPMAEQRERDTMRRAEVVA